MRHFRDSQSQITHLECLAPNWGTPFHSYREMRQDVSVDTLPSSDSSDNLADIPIFFKMRLVYSSPSTKFIRNPFKWFWG